MNQIAVSGLSGLAGGMLYGAVGGAVTRSASKRRKPNPILRGSLVAGAVGGVAATLVSALIVERQAQRQLDAPKTAYTAELRFP